MVFAWPFRKHLDEFFTKNNDTKRLEVTRQELELERERLELAQQDFEILKQREQLPLIAQLDADLADARAKLKLSASQLEDASKNLDLEFRKLELERATLMLPHQAEIEKAKALADQAERLANIEAERLKAQAELDSQAILSAKLAEYPGWLEAKAAVVQAQADAIAFKIEANREYLEVFLAQEKYNGDGDEEYEVETPTMPYKL